MTSKNKTGCHHPICMMAHDLVNSLSVIVGNCDLLKGFDQPAEAIDRLSRIRDTATQMAETLREHQCHMAVLIRSISPHEEKAAS
jgi:hypothetical protein